MTDIAPQAIEPPQVSAGEIKDEIKETTSRRKLVFRIVLVAFAVFFLTPYLLTTLYIFVDPPFSALMLRQVLTGGSVSYEWRDLDQISPNLIAQVVTSEDGRFCKHHGVDWKALDKAADAVVDGKPKGGGSTITMQTAKNLFLWNKPAILRKPFEIPLATLHGFRARQEPRDGDLPQHRGMGAGRVRRGGGGPASFRQIRRRPHAAEAAQLAAALPNPKRRNAGNPGPRTAALANRLRLRACGSAEPRSACSSPRAGKTQASKIRCLSPSRKGEALSGIATNRSAHPGLTGPGSRFILSGNGRSVGEAGASSSNWLEHFPLAVAERRVGGAAAHPDFFISRTGADKGAAELIASIIREAGLTPFYQDEDFGHADFMRMMEQGFEGQRSSSRCFRTNISSRSIAGRNTTPSWPTTPAISSSA